MEFEGPPHAERAAPSDAALPARAVDAAVGILVIAAFAYGLRLTRDSYYWADDLRLIQQSGSWEGLFDDYNGHLSVLILSLYRALVEVSGFDYTPVRVAGMISLTSVPIAYYLSGRRFLGPPLTAVLAMPLIWAAGVSLYPGELNHQLAVLGGIGCAASLNRGRRADGLLAASLTFSLMAAGGGVAVGAACLTHNILTRAPLRRWVATIVPLAAWLAWWLTASGRTNVPTGLRLTKQEQLRYAWDLSYAAVEDLTFGFRPLTVLLIAAFLGYGGWLLTRGLDASANFVAWTGGTAVWGAGLAMSRGIMVDVETFRYRMPTLCFLLLAVIPRRPIVWPPRARRAGAVWMPALAVVILALGVGRAAAVRDDYQASARRLAPIGRIGQGEALVLGLDSARIPDDQVLAFRFGNLTAGEVRELFARYGAPGSDDGEAVDERLVALRLANARRVPAPGGSCEPLTRPLSTPPTRVPVLGLWSPEERWTVEVRRFGEDWVHVADAGADRGVVVALPALSSDVPWEVRANGACRFAVPEP